jgi:hypothetical protein
MRTPAAAVRIRAAEGSPVWVRVPMPGMQHEAMGGVVPATEGRRGMMDEFSFEWELNINLYAREPVSASQYLYTAASHRMHGRTNTRCWLCGGPAYESIPVKDWVKSTFTDYHAAQGDYEAGVCVACVWATQYKCEELQLKVGKDKPQNMPAYSHFVVSGQWHVYSKAQKAKMLALLVSSRGLPIVACVTESGQKHQSFKARVNPSGQSAGWVMFETQHVWLDQAKFSELLSHVQALYNARFSKVAIQTGGYTFYPDSDLALWRQHEFAIRSQRGSALFNLAVYLVQKEENENERGIVRSDHAGDTGAMARNRPGIQEPVRTDHLDSVRGTNQVRGEHNQQLALLPE